MPPAIAPLLSGERLLQAHGEIEFGFADHSIRLDHGLDGAREPAGLVGPYVDVDLKGCSPGA